MLQHPEIKNYGLECDINLWVEFNKEVAICNVMQSDELFYERDLELIENSETYNVERKRALQIVEQSKQLGILSYNYLPKDEEELVV